MCQYLPSAGRSHRGSTAKNIKHMAKLLCYGVARVGWECFLFLANSPLPHSVCLVAGGWSTWWSHEWERAAVRKKKKESLTFFTCWLQCCCASRYLSWVDSGGAREPVRIDLEQYQNWRSTNSNNCCNKTPEKELLPSCWVGRRKESPTHQFHAVGAG